MLADEPGSVPVHDDVLFLAADAIEADVTCARALCTSLSKSLSAASNRLSRSSKSGPGARTVASLVNSSCSFAKFSSFWSISSATSRSAGVIALAGSSAERGRFTPHPPSSAALTLLARSSTRAARSLVPAMADVDEGRLLARETAGEDRELGAGTGAAVRSVSILSESLDSSSLNRLFSASCRSFPSCSCDTCLRSSSNSCLEGSPATAL
mmetsp:Transcript_14550/g.24072  ORF Transcript_14550/g.24072 Transcript_14550/m.24072 type:complete len:211 (-) Transcript_14550:367-999(-)